MALFLKRLGSKLLDRSSGSGGSSSAGDAAKNAKLRAAGVRPELLEFIKDIAVPDAFAAFPISAREAAAFGELSPMQVEHVEAVLRASPELSALRYKLCPQRMTEAAFWRTYFVLVRTKLRFGDDADDAAAAAAEETQDTAPLSLDPFDVLHACSATPMDRAFEEDEREAFNVWTANVPPPDEKRRHGTYFDD